MAQSVLITGQVIPLGCSGANKNTLTVGRDSACDIVVPYEGVSWHHARIIKSEQNEYFIEDLNSNNGTCLLRTLVSPEGLRSRFEERLVAKESYKLSSGDRVILGTIEVTFIFSESLEGIGEMYLSKILLNEAKKPVAKQELATEEQKSFIWQILDSLTESLSKRGF
jgi:pSer/pThr/pTyr-binding forkhead associated (FHA) protein